MDPMPGTCRRTVLVAAAGCAVASVGGCATDGRTAPTAAPLTSGPVTTVSTAPPGSTPPAAENTLIALDRIPVGGGVILAEQGVVLSRPAADSVLGFSATCTHSGCAVSAIRGGTVVCPCHRSRFTLSDGSVLAGPATRPLDAVRVRVEAGQVRRV